MIPEYIIERIKKGVDCRDEIQGAIGPPANASGMHWAWCCPFPDHQDKTPSFKADHDGWKCWGQCERSGDVLDWREQWHGETFQEALKALNGGVMPEMPQDPQEQAEIAAQRAEKAEKALEAKINDAQAALGQLREARSWVRYYDALTEDARGLWRARGIPNEWQDFWTLGYCDYLAWVKSPTLVIPVRGYDWEIYNVKHRLLSDDTPGGKYRQEKKGIPAAPFICLPEMSKGPLLIIEGEIKAMVTFLTMDTDKIQVAGLPAASPDKTIWGQFAGHDPVYICLDPDAYDRSKPDVLAPIEKAVDAIGSSRARVIRLSMKIDDAILAGAIGKPGLQSLMRMAR